MALNSQEPGLWSQTLRGEDLCLPRGSQQANRGELSEGGYVGLGAACPNHLSVLNLPQEGKPNPRRHRSLIGRVEEVDCAGFGTCHPDPSSRKAV